MTDWRAWAELGRIVLNALLLVGVYQWGRWVERRKIPKADDR